MTEKESPALVPMRGRATTATGLWVILRGCNMRGPWSTVCGAEQTVISIWGVPIKVNSTDSFFLSPLFARHSTYRVASVLVVLKAGEGYPTTSKCQALGQTAGTDTAGKCPRQ